MSNVCLPLSQVRLYLIIAIAIVGYIHECAYTRVCICRLMVRCLSTSQVMYNVVSTLFSLLSRLVSTFDSYTCVCICRLNVLCLSISRLSSTDMLCFSACLVTRDLCEFLFMHAIKGPNIVFHGGSGVC